MKHLLTLVFVALSTCKATAQKIIKAKDAGNYIGEDRWVEGRIISIAGPGYSSTITHYVGTDTIKVGIAAKIPLLVWSKSPKLARSTLKGKLVKAHGVKKDFYQQPYLVIRDTADLKVFL
jgi:hypothetical protein